MLLTHEVVHVATRSFASAAPTWLVEGFADQIAYDAYPDHPPAALRPLRDAVRAGLAAHRAAAGVRLRRIGRRPRPRVRPGLVAVLPDRRPVRRDRPGPALRRRRGGHRHWPTRWPAWAPPRPRCCATGEPSCAGWADDGRAEPTTLVVTNDFPPRIGGIESFVAAACGFLDDVVVLTLRAPGRRRWTDDPAVPGRPAARAAAAHAGRPPGPRPTCCRTSGATRVLFGAAAPLGLLRPELRAAGAKRIVALTHGSRSGGPSCPPTRALLRRIGDEVDALTTNSDFVAAAIAPALSAAARTKLFRLAPPVDLTLFRPGRRAAGRRRPRRCVAVGRFVPRKGFDVLLRSWPIVLGRLAGRSSRRRSWSWSATVRSAAALDALAARPGSAAGCGSPARCRRRASRRTAAAPTCSRCRCGPGGRARTRRASAWPRWRRPPAVCRCWSGTPAARRRRCSRRAYRLRRRPPRPGRAGATRIARPAARPGPGGRLGRAGPGVRGRPLRLPGRARRRCAPRSRLDRVPIRWAGG